MRSIKWAIVALCVLLFAAPAAPGETVIIAVSGQGAPDANGTLDLFDDVLLNDSGQAAFLATLAGTSDEPDDDTGIFRGSGGDITQIVREGQSVPDANGTYSIFDIPNIFDMPALNDSGQAAFFAGLADTSGEITDDTGIFRGSGGVITRIAREGQTVPDGNGKYSFFKMPALNDSGQVAFDVGLDFTSGGGADNSGIFRGSGGFTTQIVREGQAAPDGNGTFSFFSGPALNDSGQVAFHGGLSGTSDNSGTGIFRGSGGTITRIARKVQGAPDANGSFTNFGSPALNDSGQAAFWGQLTGTSGGFSDRTGIFRGSGGSIAQIARAGQAAPDGNGMFSGFDDEPVLNGSGQTAFKAFMTATSGGGADDSGIFRGSGGTLTQIARKGQGAPDGNGTFLDLGLPALNGLGHVAFWASIFNISDDEGVYISDGIDMIQATRVGQGLSGSTITGLTFASGIDEHSGLNEFGQVAYKAILLDEREVAAVFTPEVHWRAGGSGNWNQADNWTLGIAPAALYDVLIDPAGSLNVAGHYANTTVKSLSVGSTGGGLAVLQLIGGGDLAVQGTVTITGGGKIEVGAGRVLSAAALTNSGVLTGSGTVQTPLSNQTAGQIRVSTGQALVFAGSGHLNAGKVEVISGEVEFTGDLINAASTGLITGRDATLRFGGGLANSGSVALSFGTSDLYGEIDNTSFGRIIVSGNSEVTFYDDVSNTGIIQVSGGSTAVFFGDFSGNGCAGTGDVQLEGDTRPGFSPGEMSFGGNVAFGPFAGLEIELGGTVVGDEYDQLDVTGDLTLGGTLQVVLIGGFAPGVGDTFDILDWGALAGATFDAIELSGLVGRKAWDTSALYSDGEISVIGMLDGDTDFDWDVDSVDLANLTAVFGEAGDWHTDFNEDGRTDLTDFALMRANFGAGVGSSPSADPGTATPEPATLILLSAGLPLLLRRKRKS
jgi:hypothetical protein